LSQILDTVASLTPEQVNAAFKKWVDPAAISYQVAVKYPPIFPCIP
jgi:predicted Zn-dependent peptidase